MEASALQAPAGINRITVAGPLLRLRSDEQLVALFRQGHDQAFHVIHERYRTRLFAYARQMLGGSRQDAEDALQDVFLRAYGALRANDRPVSLRAWLYRVAHNRCIDQLRRPVPPAIDLFDTSRSPVHDPMGEAERREDLRRLVADVRRLPEQQRSALLMREMEGLSYAELAGALGVTVPAVKSLLVRARIGLAEANEARDTACASIRDDLALSYGKGVRASALARRHLRDCDGCRSFKLELRSVERSLAALNPSHSPLAAFAKLLGLGGAGSGAAASASAGGGAAAGGGVTALGGGAAAATATKVAAIVCSAALTVGGAAEVRQHIDHARPAPAKRSAAARSAVPVAPARRSTEIAGTQNRAAVPIGAAAAHAARAAAKRRAAAAATAAAPITDEPLSPHIDGAEERTFTATTPAASEQERTTGGVSAPDEVAPAAGDTTTIPADGTTPLAAGTAPDTSTPSTGATGTTGSAGTGAQTGTPGTTPASGDATASPASSAPPAGVTPAPSSASTGAPSSR